MAHLMYQNGRLDVLNIRPDHPTNHTYSYRISKSGEDMIIKVWKKMYGFYEGMIVTMDIGDPDIEQDNMDIWVLVDTLPILPLCEFLKHSY